METLIGKHVHFVGIGGSGLSSMAVVLKERGVLVSGSDQQQSPVTKRLQENGVRIIIGHDPDNIAGADLIVRSSAVKEDNVEVQAAARAGIPVLKRETFLPALIGQRDTIAIAGTHGKTTTTAMVAWLLHSMGSDPSYIIGGFSPDLGASAHSGKDDIFVIEADEYDHMFWGLCPRIAVVTNVEHDHPDYYPTWNEYQQAFKTFVDHLDEAGILLACKDDPGSADLLSEVQSAGRQSCSYSISQNDADYHAEEITTNQLGGCSFSFFTRGKKAVEVQLRVPGKHNVSNAVASLGVLDLLGYPLSNAANHLLAFSGTGRRFEIRGELNNILLIDDYAHHPTEIRATLAAARLRYPDSKLWVVWQPHTYSRTRTLLPDYLASFSNADRLVITSIYAAREQPPQDGFSSRDVVEAFEVAISNGLQEIFYEPELEDAASLLLKSLSPGDVLLVLSAGNADWINSYLLNNLLQR